MSPLKVPSLSASSESSVVELPPRYNEMSDLFGLRTDYPNIPTVDDYPNDNPNPNKPKRATSKILSKLANNTEENLLINKR